MISPGIEEFDDSIPVWTFEGMRAYAETCEAKRGLLRRRVTECPECGAKQIQITEWTRPGEADYRCREDRRHKWTVEMPDDPLFQVE